MDFRLRMEKIGTDFAKYCFTMVKECKVGSRW
jgi:hypothetical protein